MNAAQGLMQEGVCLNQHLVYRRRAEQAAAPER